MSFKPCHLSVTVYKAKLKNSNLCYNTKHYWQQAHKKSILLKENNVKSMSLDFNILVIRLTW